jgi:uncharacterized protein YjbJ (UPF0337 family)
MGKSSGYEKSDEGEIKMADSTEFKGRVKEAAGDLTDDQDLKNEGKADKTAGKLKDKIDDAVDKVKDAMHHDDKH